MDDIAPELLNNISADFRRLLGNIDLQQLTYLSAEQYAEAVGSALAEAFHRNIVADKLPEGRLFWNIADRILRPMLEENHRLVADAAQKVQQALNKSAGIGIKAQRAPLDEDRVAGILNKVASAQDYPTVAWVLDEPVKTFSRSVVDDTLRINVDQQGRAGLYPKIIRTAESHCCKWCSQLGGVYQYPTVPKDVYRRHARCRCSVEYIGPGAKTRRVLHSQGDAAQRKQMELAAEAKRAARVDYIHNLEMVDLDKMSLPQLRKVARDLATEYYKSGESGISFGATSPEDAAQALAVQGSRTSLKKDIKALRKKLKKGG